MYTTAVAASPTAISITTMMSANQSRFMGTRDLRSSCQRVGPLAKDQPALVAMVILAQRGWCLWRRDDRVATRTHDGDGESTQVISKLVVSRLDGHGTCVGWELVAQQDTRVC